MAMKFTNNATTTLLTGISDTATSLTVASSDGALFPTLTGADYFYCTIADAYGNVEIVKVTARSSDTFTIVRGQDGTTAATWTSGVGVELRVIAASFDGLVRTDAANTFTQTQTFSSDIDVGGDATVAGTLDVTSDATVGGTLDVTSDTTVGGTLDVTGNTTVDGTLITTGRVTNSTGTVSGPWTTATRPASPVDGLSGFNTDLDKFETWDATNNAWVSGGGATGAGGDDVFYENGQTVTANYTITTNKNAMSTGPITINSGITVTVPTGSVWVVL